MTEFSDSQFGDFMLIEPRLNCVVAGSRFDLTAADVVELCKPVGDVAL
jgi:hypothetical protein